MDRQQERNPKWEYGDHRVLIADDSIISRHLLDAPLRQEGYEVVIACNGEEAWEILQRDDAPRLAVLDWMMPGLTGPEVVSKIREKESRRAGDSLMDQNNSVYTYTLLLTSKNLKQDLINGLEAGADDYITKPFDQHELKMRLRAGARIVRLNAELRLAQAALREQATRDALTRLWNRASIRDALQREIMRAERELQPIGVVLIDIDHFKSINDNYGHMTGDAVLSETAHRMSASIRDYDLLGRYGGEEFLMVLPGCSEEETIRKAEAVRLALSREPMQLDDPTQVDDSAKPIMVTASMGVTTFYPGQGATVDGLFRVADDALYRAKESGRNRVIHLPFLHTAPPLAAGIPVVGIPVVGGPFAGGPYAEGSAYPAPGHPGSGYPATTALPPSPIEAIQRLEEAVKSQR